MKIKTWLFSFLPILVWAQTTLVCIRSPEVFFDLKSFELKQSEKTNLDSVVIKFLKENKSVYVELLGNSSCFGSRRFKEKLSVKRVEVVRDYLMSKEIDSSRIVLISIGDTNPEFPCEKCKCDNATMKRNDRVEIKFISKEIKNEIRQKKSQQ